MSQLVEAQTPICEAECLKRQLAVQGAYLEHDGAAWRLHGRARQRQAESGLVAALERAGALMRLPDGRLILAAPAARRDLIQATVINAAGDAVTVTLNTTESPLGWMLRRRGGSGAAPFDPVLVAAAERLRRDYTGAQMEPRVTAALDGFIPSGSRGRSGAGSGEISTIALAAKQRFFAALDAVGPELSGILTEVCCLTAGLEQAERVLALPVRAGKAVLHLALTRLARHYGFLAHQRAGEGHRAIRDWRRPDARPGVAIR